MPKVIFKCNYIKSGKAKSHLNNLVNYIATREGVQKFLIEDKSLASENQKQVIDEILNEFPDTKNLHEYKDYIKNPSMKNASEYISTALEFNLDKMAKKENYIDYIATRPRVEKISTHGLFTSGEDEVDLEKVTKEIANHSGNIWTPIISLTREDAVLTGMDNAQNWKLLAEQQAMMIAENLKIPFNDFKWYASYHDESYHPHIHMVCYSTDPSKGYLTQNGIDNIRSSLTREIFSKELNLIYAEKTVRRDKLKEKSKEVFDELKEKILTGEINNPQLEKLMSELKEKLDNASGKKVYGYLKPSVKEIVDKIVDELENIPEIKNCYDLWWEMQQEIYSNYQDKIIEPLPLSKQTEFKSIKNMIINEIINSEDTDNIILDDKKVKSDEQDYYSYENNSTQNQEHRQTQTNMGMSVFSIFRNLSKMFEDNINQTQNEQNKKLDSKQIQKLREKKQSQGQKLDLKEMKF